MHRGWPMSSHSPYLWHSRRPTLATAPMGPPAWMAGPWFGPTGYFGGMPWYAQPVMWPETDPLPEWTEIGSEFPGIDLRPAGVPRPGTGTRPIGMPPTADGADGPAGTWAAGQAGQAGQGPMPESAPEPAAERPRYETIVPPFAADEQPVGVVRHRPIAEPTDADPPQQPPTPMEPPLPGGPLLEPGQPDYWEDLRTIPNSTTAAAPSPVGFGGRLHVFITGMDGQVQFATMLDGDRWGEWQQVARVSTSLRSTPVAAGRALYLFFVDPGGQVRVTTLTPGRPWTEPVEAPRVQTRSPVGAVATEAGVVLFFRGPDNRVYSAELTEGRWSEPVAHPGLITDDQPIPVLYDGQLTVFAKDMEGVHWYRTLTGPQARWQEVPRPAQTYTPVGVAIYRDELWVFSQYPDFSVWFNAPERPWRWRTWREVPELRTENAPAPLVHDQRLYVFGRNKADSQVGYLIRRERPIYREA